MGSLRKQTIIDKLKAFFEKYFGLGINTFEEKDESSTYNDEPELMMVAEESAPYNADNGKEDSDV